MIGDPGRQRQPGVFLPTIRLRFLTGLAGPLAFAGHLAFVGLLTFAAPIGAQDQSTQTDPAPERIGGYSAIEIERFARVFMEVAEIRDELQQDLARFHDEGQRRAARERADTGIRGVMEAHEVEEEGYEEFIRRIGLDEALRDAFDEALKRLREEDGSDALI